MNPTTHPSNRGEHAMAYDAESDRVVLFGGYPLNDETWVYDFDGDNWSKVEPAIRPPAMAAHPAMAYDAESDRIVLFGGSRVGGPSDETWVYDFNTNTWTEMTPVASPPPRYSHNLAYDSESDRVILFGGFKAFSTPSDETWAYDFDSNVWTRMDPPLAPSPRVVHGMAYDSQSDRVVLFGGGTGGGTNSDETWTYDFNSNAWTKMTPATAPLATPNAASSASSIARAIGSNPRPESCMESRHCSIWVTVFAFST